MRKQSDSVRTNIRFAKTTWGDLPWAASYRLRKLTRMFGLSVGLGDMQLIDGHWFVTHAGLLRLAQRRRCHGIKTSLQKDVSDPIASRWVFKATVFNNPGSRGFVGYGDAEPSNVSPMVLGAEMRVAETRAVSRALRKAYGVPLCSLEELRYLSAPSEPAAGRGCTLAHPNEHSFGNGQPRLRDKLSLLIRNYELDPTLVKRYAADFCGTETLREASRDLVEAFVATIAKEAANDRAALVCKLNSYNQPEEVRP